MRCGTEIYLTMESKIFYQWGHIIWRIEVERQFPKKGYKPNNIPTYFWWRFKKNFYWDTVAFSIVEQNQSDIHIQISTPFWTFFWFRSSQSLKYEFPLLYSMFSLVWLSFFVIIVSIVYMCQSQSPVPPPLCPLVSLFLFSTSVSISTLQVRLSVPFF